MRSSPLSSATSSFLLFCLASAATTHATLAEDGPYAYLKKRAVSSRVTKDPSLLSNQTFDFVIIGGGPGGLSLASRLSEQANVTVAVIEAGTDGSEKQDAIYIPGNSYLNGLTVGAQYDWQYQIDTTTYTTVGGSDLHWPRGRVLGGSAAVNGLFWCRGSKPEYDAWNTLNPNSQEDWSWDNFNEYMKKVETLHEPEASQKDQFQISWEASAHGTNGPIQVGWPSYIYDPMKHWVPSFINMGVRHATDGADGNNRGVTMTPSSLNPSNDSRSDPVAGYINPLPPRQNLVILTQHLATKINFNSTKTDDKVVANSVTFTPSDASAGPAAFTVFAAKEVILAGGTINSPQLLQLSGIGPSKILKPLNIDVVVDLPGVGYNLQDHAATALYYNSNDQINSWANLKDNETLAAEQLDLWHQGQDSQWSYINEGIAYPALTDLMSKDQAASFVALAEGSSDDMTGIYQNDFSPDATVMAGIAAQQKITLDTYLNSDVGLLELLMTMLGGAPGQMGFQIALQHPFSRGAILINSTDPFVQPKINPAYLSNPLDMQIIRLGIQFIRRLAGTPPMNTYVTDAIFPSSDVTSDEDLEKYIRTNLHTEYHPVGTCSMQPLEHGGVVNTSLVVYGTANVRVVDASVIPLIISAHTMITTYGVGEKAADIITKYYASDDSKSTVSDEDGSLSTDVTSTSTQDVGAKGNNNAQADSQSMSTGAKIGIGAGAAGLGLLLLLGLLWFLVARRKSKKGGSNVMTRESHAWDSDTAHLNAYSTTPGQGNPSTFSPAAAYAYDESSHETFRADQAAIDQELYGPAGSQSYRDLNTTIPLDDRGMAQDHGLRDYAPSDPRLPYRPQYQ